MLGLFLTRAGVSTRQTESRSGSILWLVLKLGRLADAYTQKPPALVLSDSGVAISSHSLSQTAASRAAMAVLKIR